METTRICKTCSVSKPLTADNFLKTYNTRKDGVRVQGFRNECKLCKVSKDEASKLLRKGHKTADNTPKPAACANVDCDCPAAELSFGWREDIKDWRSECKACVADRARKEEYSNKSRAKRKAKDPTGYLQHNKEVQTAWLAKHPGKVAEYQAAHRASAYAQIKDIDARMRREHGASHASYFEEADRHAMRNKMLEPCHYCGHEPAAGEKVNGLNRMVAGGPYNDANTVPACAACNIMKNVYTIDEFLTCVHDINNHLGLHEVADTPSPVFGGTGNRRAAPTKEKLMLLTKEERISLWTAECSFCGRSPSLGIDRIDPAGPYEPSNVRPCCTQCNYMRKDFDDTAFENHVARIFHHTAQHVLGDVSKVLSSITGPRKPVAATVGMYTLIFPSLWCSFKILAANQEKLRYAINEGTPYLGARWAYASVHDYRAQRLNQETSASVLGNMLAENW